MDDEADSKAPPAAPNEARDQRAVQGSAADGLVTVTMSLEGDLLEIDIRPGEFIAEDPPGLDDMGDVVVEALIAAKARAQTLTTAMDTASTRAVGDR